MLTKCNIMHFIKYWLINDLSVNISSGLIGNRTINIRLYESITLYDGHIMKILIRVFLHWYYLFMKIIVG